MQQCQPEVLHFHVTSTILLSSNSHLGLNYEALHSCPFCFIFGVGVYFSRYFCIAHKTGPGKIINAVKHTSIQNTVENGLCKMVTMHAIYKLFG